MGGKERRVARGISVVLALGLTVFLDRYTPLVELVAKPLAPSGYHDMALLLLFALELVIFEPIISATKHPTLLAQLR